MEAFSQLGISEPLLKSIKELNFETPTEIQERTIPLTLEGKDVLGWSSTGSGKTLAFGASIIQKTEPGKGVQALVLTPTRELATQVADALAVFGKHKELEIGVIFGGMSYGPQLEDLEYCDIIVATPGRLLDHIDRGSADFSHVRVLVLDEADKMFDMGFIEDVQQIIQACPEERQTLMYSATHSDKVVSIAQNYMHEPVEIQVQPNVDPSKLKQIFYNVDDKQKFSLLVHLLKAEHTALTMVFCNSRKSVDFVANNLKCNGIDAVAIHGGLPQEKRNKIIKRFGNADKLVLVCTDVAARGLDIDDVTHVYNYDIPKEAQQYVHRVGRTARAGNEGVAINLLSYRDYDNMDRVFREHRDLKIAEEQTPQFKRARVEWRMNGGGKRDPRGRFGNRNHGSKERRQGKGRVQGNSRRRNSF